MQQVKLRRRPGEESGVPSHHLFPLFTFTFPFLVACLELVTLKGADFVKGGGSETEVTWEDQQNINRFSKLNNRFHELEDEIKAAKTGQKLDSLQFNAVLLLSLIHHRQQERNDNLEDASNELILTDEEVVRFQIGEVFAHVPKDEVEERIEQMKEVTTKNLEKLEEEKESVLAQMAELKKILYAKFKDSINLEED
ncbi:hypothetical protein CDL15_Pgr001621 [Punica granatum]|uniref:Prefoldin subunit 4 n=1 Tax=Punica granatum TaxID=22663 RepID=A0A218XAR8_PUNGR|nr:hypothetical protein CDL15_Pgr001621 [Punica granatum]